MALVNKDVENKINSLTDQEGLAVLNYLTNSMLDSLPDEQALILKYPDHSDELISDAMRMLLNRFGFESDLVYIRNNIEINKNIYSKNFLYSVLETENKNVINMLNGWLNKPVKQRTAFVDGIDLTPIIYAASFALIVLTCGARYRKTTGWEYDPKKGLDCIKACLEFLTKNLKGKPESSSLS